MDPGPRVRAFDSIERSTDFLDLIPEHWEVDALGPPWTASGAVYIWRTPEVAQTLGQPVFWKSSYDVDHISMTGHFVALAYTMAVFRPCSTAAAWMILSTFLCNSASGPKVHRRRRQPGLSGREALHPFDLTYEK